MAYKILILGASYGSLLGTKFLMAGHDVTLVCRTRTAALINEEGTEVRIKLKDEDAHRSILSRDLPGRLRATVPEDAVPENYDLVCLAMQEPQYGAQALWSLLVRIAEARIPCLSVMNMPPLPYLKRVSALDTTQLESSFANPRVWDRFDPDLVTLCSPDPQAFRPPEGKANILHVGLPTNFRVARFGADGPNRMLEQLEADVDAVRLDCKDVPVKLRVFQSLFVPMAKWSMLLTGNYRCITPTGMVPIRDAVLGDMERSRAIYAYVDTLAQRLGADPADGVPFEKYAKAAENLCKPSSAARAVDAGAPIIERVDMLVKSIGDSLGSHNAEIDAIVATVDTALARNECKSA